jgi:hypothetical protein
LDNGSPKRIGRDLTITRRKQDCIITTIDDFKNTLSLPLSKLSKTNKIYELDKQVLLLVHVKFLKNV